ncbi:MAG: hypothetical protein VW397_05050 [Candidatus Margulisiibacteriota bacterium]
MMLLTHLFFVSSTFLMNSLIPISPLSRTVFFVAPITTLFWWAFYFFPNTNLFTQDIVASVYILIPLFSFLIVYDRLDQLTSFQKQLVMVGSVFCWGVCITNLLAILILNHSLINSNYIMIFNSLFFMFHSWILHRDQQAIQLSRFKFGIRNEVLFNVVGYCVFFTLYFSGLSQLKPYIPLTFYFMYFLLFLPYIFHFPIRSLRMYFQAMLFSIICIIVMKFHAVFDPFIMNGFHLDYIAIMTCLIGGLFLAATVYVFEFLVRSFDGIYPFSVVSKEVLQKCIELLNSTLNFEEIKQILNSNYLFKLHHFEIALWVIQHNQLRTVTSHLPE